MATKLHGAFPESGEALNGKAMSRVSGQDRERLVSGRLTVKTFWRPL